MPWKAQYMRCKMSAPRAAEKVVEFLFFKDFGNFFIY